MKNKTAKTLIICYAAITVFSFIVIAVAGRNYTVYLHKPYENYTTEAVYSQEGVVTQTSVKEKGEYITTTFRTKKAGKTSAKFIIYNSDNDKETTAVYLDITILPVGVIYITGYDFGGYQFTVLAMALVTLCTFIVCLKQFKVRMKTQFFSYKTVLDLAFIVFFGLQTVIYLGLFAAGILYPQFFDSWQIYTFAGLIMAFIFVLSLPLLIIFSGFISFSNLSLIRHEGLRTNNLFGLLISAMLFAGSLVCIYVTFRYPTTVGLQLSQIRDNILRTVFSSAFVYFECVLIATQICTQYAAKHEPKYNQDFIMILGCKIRNDGTPTPLLKGRIDRAVEFYGRQLEATGKKAYFIPSGGKGDDEVISEAESMKNYLIEKGIDESIIHPETKSTTTLENMRFSKAIADEIKPDSNILFSTTNYHIFRSGILSAKAGLKADGIGAKTKWYFWPNAQMREFIGLLAGEWKINILFIAATVFLSVMFANISTIISIIAK